MTISVETDQFKWAITLAKGATEKHTSTPIAAFLKITASNGLMSVSGVGHTAEVKINIPCGEGTLDKCLPGGTLVPIIGVLDGTLTIEDSDSSVLIKTSTGQYQVPAMATDDFPSLSQFEGALIDIPSEAFNGIVGCTHAASIDPTKMILQGVHFNQSEDGLEFAATNGHILATINTGLQGTDVPLLTVPAKAIQDLIIPLVAQTKVNSVGVRVCNSNGTQEANRVSFEIGDHTVTVRILEGLYPHYRQLFPQKFNTVYKFSRQQLLSAIAKVRVVAASQSNTLKLGAEGVFFSIASGLQSDTTAKESIPFTVEKEGVDPFTFGLNCEYLEKALKKLSGEHCYFNLNSPTTPIVITTDDHGERVLIMPIQFRNT